MHRHLLIVLSFLLSIPTVAAQSQDAPDKNSPAVETADKNLESERLRAARRANAQSLLINLAVDARYFSDENVRARALARIADMLWESDRDRSRSLFRSAWDAAEMADAKARELMLEEIRQQQAGNAKGGYSVSPPASLRQAVSDLAARRDSALGEEFLIKYGEQKAREAEAERRRSPNPTNPTGRDEARAERFRLSQELLSDGEVERALQFADPGLGSISIETVDFLTSLRTKNAAAADLRYAAMITGAIQNPQSEANTVSLLTSYIFTPHQQAVFFANGATMRGNRFAPAVEVSRELRAAFFHAANTILSRPLGDYLPGRATDAQYLAVKRLMPVFERYAPPETVAALKAQFVKLGAVASNRALNENSQMMRVELDAGGGRPYRNDQSEGRGPDPTAPPDREQSALEERERAKTPAERDRINVKLALLMVDKDDRRAREYVDKIDDLELRNATRAYVDACIAWNLLQKRNVDIDRVLELVSKGALTHFQKSWLLSDTARKSQVVKRDREQFMSLIDYAATEARRIQTSDPDRPRAFFAVADAVFHANRERIWEVMSEAIKAANSADQFTGTDGKIAFRLNMNGINSSHEHGFRNFDVAGIFTNLANEDYDRAVELARGFQNAVPRANATIAIAKAVLEEKKK